MEEKKKPGRPLSVLYADAKQAITRQVGNTMAAYGLPIFMVEGILSGILAEIRTNATNELADDTARYEDELKEYYEAELKEKQEAFEKEKEELITLFENPDLPGTTPEGEPEPDPEGEPEPDPEGEPELDLEKEPESDPEEKTVIEKKYIGGETVVEEVD